MFRNLVNMNDLRWLLRKGSRRRLSRALRIRSHGRVLETWGHVRVTTTHWYDLPVVVQHRAMRAAGGVGDDHVDRIVSRWIGDRNNLVGLSIGCGIGVKEIRWARTNRFERLDAFDLTDELILKARENARAAGVQINFYRGDVLRNSLPEDAYDLVIFEDALHHLAPLPGILDRVRRTLHAGGLLIVNDFVGPSRFQWLPQQLRLANDMLARVPECYRRQLDGTVKLNVFRPSRLRMILTDPSEAVQSGKILPLLAERFTVLEERPLGGSLVYLVLSEIAQNFADRRGTELLETMLAEEDSLIDSGRLGSDYVLGVYRRPA